jgi:hypothetical protein
MLAHFHWWKGHLDLLRAVEPLDDVWVILAGGDLYGCSSTAYRNEVLSFAQSQGFAHRVRCVGAVDDVGPVYAAADVVAHCSIRPEPFGRTLVEAALAEKPVVASSAGAPGEFVRHSQTGLLFAPGTASYESRSREPRSSMSPIGSILDDTLLGYRPSTNLPRSCAAKLALLCRYQGKTCKRLGHHCSLHALIGWAGPRGSTGGRRSDGSWALLWKAGSQVGWCRASAC